MTTALYLNQKIKDVKMPKKYHNHETQPSRGTTKEGEMRNKNNKTNSIYETVDGQAKKKNHNRGTAFKQTNGKLGVGCGSNQFYSS